MERRSSIQKLIGENIIAVIVGAILTISGSAVLDFWTINLPNHKKWDLNNPNSLHIVASRVKYDSDSGYKKALTGIAQLRSLSYLLPNLETTYGSLPIVNQILMSHEVNGVDLEKDLITLGGPKSNETTKRLLTEINLDKFVTQDLQGIHWKKNSQTTTYTGKRENSKVIEDYGLILRTKNPFDSNNLSSAIILSGHHSYGTIAAAKYFSQTLNHEFFFWSHELVIVIVKCKVIDDEVVKIEVVEKYIK